MALGQAIRELRLQADLTQEALAHEAGITVGQLSKIERGHSDPRWGTVRRIAHGLHIPLPDLATKEEAWTGRLDNAETARP